MPGPVARTHVACYAPPCLDHPITQGTAAALPRFPGGGPTFPVPSFLPDAARTLLPWARRTALKTAQQGQVSLSDAWDETLAALLRAHAYFKPGAGTFATYAKTSVARGLQRYLCRAARRQRAHEPYPMPSFSHPSAESMAALAESAREL